MTPPVTSLTSTTALADAVAAALADGGGALPALASRQPRDRRDRFLTLLAIYDLHTAPLEDIGDAARLQGHPAVAELKYRLEADWLAELELAWVEAGSLSDSADPERVVKAMRAVAAQDRLPTAYRWLAKQASWPELVEFLALEGGPDGGFDDLVAVCQVGLAGSAKLELGKNYWDEMGNGNLERVHTVLHQRMAAALQMPHVPRDEQPVAALERAALGGLLATNRWLQPEMLGALGLLELQAGPRCRLVLQAFDRLGAPADAYPFYVEHAEVDPVHGKDWMDKAIVPTVTERPEWGPRIVKGAWWRSSVNLAFFDAVHRELIGDASAA
jgi:Iron-containing redox enzyme